MTVRQPPREKGAKACTIGSTQPRKLDFLRLFFWEYREMRCFFMREKTRYEVCTRWGCFSLDEASYQDYLAGKLWISWEPGKRSAPVAEQICRNASERAVQLRKEAASNGAYAVFAQHFPGSSCTPYCRRMRDIPIREMTLSVRASNCLMRAGVDTFGKLTELMKSDAGLMSVRNLGLKSAEEIHQVFFDCCYQDLSEAERSSFWQEALDAGTEK